MGAILVYSEKDGLAFELLAAARAFQAARGGGEAVAALPGATLREAAPFFAHGADRACVAESPALAGLRAEAVAPALATMAERTGADTVLLDSTRRGKELAPRLAQKLGAGCITDVTALRWEGEWRGERSALGGNTVATDRVTAPRAVIAVMPGVFAAAPAPARSGEVITLPLQIPASTVKVVESRVKGGAGAGLDKAEIVIGVGRGFVKEQDLALARALAGALRAEIGCSRTLATDYHWLEEDRMIGLSGKRIKPRLYLALGISGQIQHTVGIAGAKLIAAVNKDKDAPIFRLADYGVVGDLYQVLPALTARLRR